MFVYFNDRYHGNAVSRDAFVHETRIGFTVKLEAMNGSCSQQMSDIHCESKNRHQTLAHNFTKY